MKRQLGALAAAAFLAVPAHAQVEVQWWHSMGGALGEWVNDLAKEFNASQKDYKVTPTFKGSYDESMTAAIAAFRASCAADGSIDSRRDGRPESRLFAGRLECHTLSRPAAICSIVRPLATLSASVVMSLSSPRRASSSCSLISSQFSLSSPERGPIRTKFQMPRSFSPIR